MFIKMCGIMCLIHNSERNSSLKEIYETCKLQIQRRGPDCFAESSLIASNNRLIDMCASVLWLQGANLTKQPINTASSLFSFNGDVFGGSSITTNERLTQGDTELVLHRLETKPDLIETLYYQIEGPYAFLWFDKKTSNLYFGRDVFGRRSLLISVEFYADSKINALLITSVAHSTNLPYMEIPAIGIFCYNLDKHELLLFPWPNRHKNFEEKLSNIKKFLNCNIKIVDGNVESSEISEYQRPNGDNLIIYKNIKDLPTAAAFKYLLEDKEWLNRVVTLHTKLENAIFRRITTQPPFCKDCIKDRSTCTHCRVGILFSGGVDCTILALIADKFIDKAIPIDLLNVAFDETKDYNTPDRQTGLASLEELKSLCPARNWNFVCINVSRVELAHIRQTRIRHLIFPLNTVLDDSLGCALWFAARGKSLNYESPCRVLLVGMGADELFGGYTRHRAAYKKEGWLGLSNSLAEDWANIAHRNLARDDRVVSDHGRQLRTPYLDEEVVRYVQSLKVWHKTYPSADVALGFGEKILLRTLAYHLGLNTTATFRKRALQFGSRIADKRENAHDVSTRLSHM